MGQIETLQFAFNKLKKSSDGEFKKIWEVVDKSGYLFFLLSTGNVNFAVDVSVLGCLWPSGLKVVTRCCGRGRPPVPDPAYRFLFDHKRFHPQSKVFVIGSELRSTSLLG